LHSVASSVSKTIKVGSEAAPPLASLDSFNIITFNLIIFKFLEFIIKNSKSFLCLGQSTLPVFQKIKSKATVYAVFLARSISDKNAQAKVLQHFGTADAVANSYGQFEFE